MQKPRFGVVALATCLLAGLGLGLGLLRRQLPPQPENDLGRETDEFLKLGAFQQIRWRKLEPSTLAEAKRLDRPILLLLGTAWSREARQADSLVFTDQDVQSYLERNFVCARLDLDAHPEWVGAFLPLSRAIANFGVAFQIVYLDPSGEVVDFFGRRPSIPATDPTLFLDEFVAAREAFDAQRTGQMVENSAIGIQKRDLELISAAPSGMPRFAEFSEALRGKIDPVHGGFPGFGQTPRPLAIQTLILSGDLQSAGHALLPALRSTWVDWLDGGFFRRSRRADWSDVEYDKLAVANAENMAAAALYASLAEDPFAERIAKSAFDALTGEFSASGLVATARIGDENQVGRSARASFSAKDFRRFWSTGFLSPDEAANARDLFGLAVETNPQMSPRVASPSHIDDPRFEPTLALLRKRKEEVRNRFTTRAYAHVNGAVAAALYGCARLWGDPARMAKAGELFDALSAFGAASDVTHGTVQSLEDAPFLGDYLAVADACLARFLAVGDAAALGRGARVLARARELFAGELGWTATVPSRMSLLPDTRAPGLLDNGSEAQTAKAIRLCSAYGRLMPFETFNPVEEATELATRYGGFIHDLGLPACGVIAAAHAVMDDGHAFAVGAGAIGLASRLYRRVPTRLVAPAVGPVRPDLQSRPAGLYVVRGGAAQGPFDVDRAASELGWVYRVESGVE